MSISAGQWREHLLDGGASWPSTWQHFERAKFLSADHRRLFKFEGYGHFGAEVYKHTQRIADAGFGPPPEANCDGFACYPVVEGRAMTRADVSSEFLKHVANYCAWRAEHFQCDPRPVTELERMMHTNLSEALGEECELPALQVERPVIADGKMHPYEWRITPRGQFLKVDAASHGDDHFFPGPTDIAWDLAGVAVEWQLNEQARDFLLQQYHRASGDDAGRRLPGFLLAYALFRLGYCTMAAESLGNTEEAERFRRDVESYRAVVVEQLKRVIVGV